MANRKNSKDFAFDAAGNSIFSTSSPSSSTVTATTSLDSKDNGSNFLNSLNPSRQEPLKNATNKSTTVATESGNILNPLQNKIETASSSVSSSETSIPISLLHIASFHRICIITALLPLATLFTCFVSAYVFQYDEVHETHCRVYNIIPSISAITGVSPQRYFWRLSIAFHLGPRIPITFIYRNYYESLLGNLERRAPDQIPKTKLLIHLIWLLNCIEICSLGGVTYISNRENYPMHEKIFITFMICSLCHMLATLKLNGILHDDLERLTHHQRESLKWKRILFILSILSTIGLLIFFAKHRFYCHDLAFTWFAFFEYLIAIANMLFHFTIIWDFPSQYMVLVQGSKTEIQKLFSKEKKID